jgi:ammonium transporter, Amt family
MRFLRRIKTPLFSLIGTFAMSLFAASAFAEDAAASAVDTGDTAWILTSAALVLLMTPALAFFYGGLVRKKNILSVLMQCFMIACLITIQWVIIGYTLSFGPDVKGFIGNLSWLGLKGVGQTPNADYAATIPHQAFMIYQCMFAIITPALILGAFAERMKFGFVYFLFYGRRSFTTRFATGYGPSVDL